MNELMRIARMWGFKVSWEYMMMGAVQACITYSPVRAAWHEMISNPGVYTTEAMAVKHLIQNMSNHIKIVVDEIEIERHNNEQVNARFG